MIPKNIKFGDKENIPESSHYFESKADSVVCVGTNAEGDESFTFVFLDSYPIVGQDNGNLTVTGLEKRKVASITIGKNKANAFYESLKHIFES